MILHVLKFSSLQWCNKTTTPSIQTFFHTSLVIIILLCKVSQFFLLMLIDMFEFICFFDSCITSNFFRKLMYDSFLCLIFILKYIRKVVNLNVYCLRWGAWHFFMVKKKHQSQTTPCNDKRFLEKCKCVTLYEFLLAPVIFTLTIQKQNYN